MEILVLQHINIEDPGYIKDLMIKDGVNITTIELDEGEKIPSNLNFFDGMLCICLLYTSPSPRDTGRSRMPSSA